MPPSTTRTRATTDLVNAVDRSCATPTRNRRLLVRANADTRRTPRAVAVWAAKGIGLCRTEHMFLGDRKRYVEKLILAETDEEREEALAELPPCSARTSSGSSR